MERAIARINHHTRFSAHSIDEWQHRFLCKSKIWNTTKWIEDCRAHWHLQKKRERERERERSLFKQLSFVNEYIHNFILSRYAFICLYLIEWLWIFFRHHEMISQPCVNSFILTLSTNYELIHLSRSLVSNFNGLNTIEYTS